MSSQEFEGVRSAIYKVRNQETRVYPFEHAYIRSIFSDDLYSKIIQNLPSESEMRPIEEVRPVKGYKERFVLNINDTISEALSYEKAAFWMDLSANLRSGEFATAMLDLFKNQMEQRFKGKNKVELYDEILLVNDRTNYSLGPHTDTPRKVVTALFYLPEDNSHLSLGTSIYQPKDPGFVCPGGPHHTFDKFRRIHTVDYAPNSMFTFFKTNNSFHGVERVTEEQPNRWLMLYDIYEKLQ